MLKFILLLLGLCLSFVTLADQFWTLTSPSKVQARKQSPIVLKHFQLDIDAFNTSLSQLSQRGEIIISLPRVDGSLSQFYVSSTQVMATDLANKYPNLKTFKIRSVNNKNIHGRMELIDDRLTAMINTGYSQELLNPNDSATYQSYSTQHKGIGPKGTFSCGVKMRAKSNTLSMNMPKNSQYRSAPNTLKKLRVAIATTVEYSEKFCGTTSAVLAEVATAVNRINEVYESELAITLELVSGNEDILFLTSDNYENNDPNQMLTVNRSVIDAVIGNANYDLGHVFSAGNDSGLANVGVACSSRFKANGVTGRVSPLNDPFWIDFVAHEMGHQLGAEHTFNGTTASCSGNNRASNTAYEPGSGSTIMGYAGICGGENLQSNSDASFHFSSIDLINSATQSCGVSVSYSSVHNGASNLNAPTANAGVDYNIPINTPFMLTANANISDNDADNDRLYYQWDGADKGSSTNLSSFGTDDGISRALFRSNNPQTNKVRYFPSLSKLLSGASHKGEALPTTSRDINFRLKVTDNKGGLASDDLKLISHSSIGPFLIKSQSTKENYSSNEVVTIEWEVASTTSAPVSCSTVDIELLNINADGSKFSQLPLLSNAFNSGSAQVSLPNISSSKSRFLIKCSNNVFFAINTSDFTIAAGASSTVASNEDFSTGVDGGLAASSYVSTTGTCLATETPVEGGGAMGVWFFSLLTSLLMARRRL